MQVSVPYRIHTHGKLLLSGEYFVLDGALALAVPTKKGQELIVEKNPESNQIHWESLDYEGETWFEGFYSIDNLDILKADDVAVAGQLGNILFEALKLKGQGVNFSEGLKIQTRLDFPRDWGLGSSSTLIAAIAEWLKVDAYDLLWNSFGGSGYDIACALADGPILYQIKEGRPVVTPCQFDPEFKQQLYFVYLGKKQSSRNEIKKYRSKGKVPGSVITEVNAITEAMLNATSQQDFDQVLQDHEKLVSGELGLSRVKELYFMDFPGQVKSLGAWGGDFVLVSSPMNESETKQWFVDKGFPVVISFDEMVL